VLCGVTAVVAQTNTGGSGSSNSAPVMVSTLAGPGRLRTPTSPNIFLEFDELAGIVSDPAGSIITSERFSRSPFERGHKISPTGDVTARIEIPSNEPFLPGSVGFAIDNSGSLYFTKFSRPIDSSYHQLGMIGTLSPGGVEGVFFSGSIDSLGLDFLPTALSVSSAVVVYAVFGGSSGARLVSFSTSGVPQVHSV
jgi:hypothetical protein